MYQGKHHKRSHRRSGKSVALLVSLLLIIGVTAAGTIAFLLDSDGPLRNIFNPSEITTTVVEKLDGTTKENVTIMNTGDTEAWIRAAVVITWQDKDGNVYGQAPVAGTNYTIDYGTGHNWIKGKDGFWYYTKPVAGGKSTENLIDSCTPVGVAPADGYYLTVEIFGSAIQSKPADVFDTEWVSSGLTVNDADTDPMKWTLEQGGARE